MSEQIITSNPEILKRYHTKPTQVEDTPESLWCNYCQSYKKQIGRFFVCKCSGMQIRSKSGISVKKSLKFKP